MGFNFDKVQALIKFIAKSGVSEVDLETDEFKINVKNGPERVVEKIVEKPQIQPIQVPVAQAVEVQQVAPQTIKPEPVPAAKEEKTAAASENLITIKSPMIGTFYRSSAPDKPPFIAVGDAIEQGKVLCIIEAMKLFNEIESEVSGKIVKVLVDDTKPVEYDQPLFLVEPN